MNKFYQIEIKSSLMQQEIKIVLVGNTSVGKTCIVKQETTKVFSENTVSTLGASFVSEIKTFGDIEVRLQIWDTAGQERYRGMTPMYYRNAQAAIITYAVDVQSSFESIDSWVDSINNNAEPDIVLFLVANKIDLPNREVSADEGREKAESIGAKYYEVSAKTGQGIEELFNVIPRIYFETHSEQVPKAESTVQLKEEPTGNRKKCC